MESLSSLKEEIKEEKAASSDINDKSDRDVSEQELGEVELLDFRAP